MLSIQENKDLLLNYILNCDPLLRDTACQIRVINLLYLYDLISKTTRENPLDPLAERACIRYILLCDILTKFGNKQYNELKDLDLKSALVPDILPKSNLDTPTQKEKFLTQARSEVAEQSIIFLKNNHQIIFDGYLINYFNKDYLYINSSKLHIMLLPCFMSTQIMLNFIKQHQSLLAIHLIRKNIQDETGNEEIIGEQIIYYSYHAGSFTVVLPTEDQVAVVIEMESYVTANQHLLIESFYASLDFDTFIEAFKKENIAKIIMMSAAAHTQTPSGTKGNLEALARDFSREIVSPNMRLAEVDIDLDVCSIQKYRDLYSAAFHYRLTESNPYRCPIMIKHIRVLDPNQLKQKLEYTANSRGSYLQQYGIFSQPIQIVQEITMEDSKTLVSNHG